MTMRLALIIAATALVSAAALAQETAAPKRGEPQTEAQAFLESCAIRKFETTVEMTRADGKKRGRKVTLCGKAGQSDSDWIRTLKDAASKVEADKAMDPAVKAQIVAALTAEIAKIGTAHPAAADPALAAITPPVALEPAVAAVVPPAAAMLPPAADVMPPEERVEYSSVPPLPAPKPASKALAASPAATVKKPRLTIRCLAPGERGGGSTCDFLEPDTRLSIRADEDLVAGTSLRFLRKGDVRGEVALMPLQQGQFIRSKLPSQLCVGVAKTKVEIQVIGGSGKQVLDTLGPYGLRC